MGQFLDRYVYGLPVSDSFLTGMCIVCQYQTVSGQVCVLYGIIRQFMDRYVHCLSVSDSLWTGLSIVCQYQTVYGQV